MALVACVIATSAEVMRGFGSLSTTETDATILEQLQVVVPALYHSRKP